MYALWYGGPLPIPIGNNPIGPNGFIPIGNTSAVQACYLPEQEDPMPALPSSARPPSAAPTRVRTPAEVGAVVRASRVEQGVDQVTTAGLSGVGVRFLGELERGKSTVRLALVLQVLERLGLDVWIVPRGQRPPG